MNSIQNQKQKSFPVETVNHLCDLRSRFIDRFKIEPSTMQVGSAVFAGLPMAHNYPCWAIEGTLVLKNEKLPEYAVVIPKPPELRAA